MVKTPRIHKQCPDTAVSFSWRTDAAFPSRKFSQCSCCTGSLLSPWATQKSTLTCKVPCVLFSRKGYFLKDKFSLDTTTVLGEGGNGSPSIVCHILEKHILISNVVLENNHNYMQQQLYKVLKGHDFNHEKKYSWELLNFQIPQALLKVRRNTHASILNHLSFVNIFYGKSTFPPS